LAPAALLPPAESVFLLRGQDIGAPAAVRFWAQAAKKQGAEERTIKAALQVADDMETWSTRKTAGYALQGFMANPTSSSFCCSKPSGSMRRQ